MDESQNSGDDSSSDRAAAKKTTRRRTTTKAASAKPKKSKASSAASTERELPLEHAPAPKREEAAESKPSARERDREEKSGPRERPSEREEKSPAPREIFNPRSRVEEPASERETRSQTPAEGGRSDDNRQSSEARGQDEGGGSEVMRSHDDRGQPEEPSAQPQEGGDGQRGPAHQNGQGGGGHGGHGAHHGHQGGHHHGGGGGDHHGNRNEPFWKRDKRNKRKRGKHGGGGGGAPWQDRGPQHPPQPAPPSLQPTYGDLPNPERFNDLAALKTIGDEISAGQGEPIELHKIYAMTLHDLTAEARRLGAAFEGAPNRKQLLTAILKKAADSKQTIIDRGWIDLTDRGHGFIVHEAVNYRLYPEDPYLPESLIKHFGLKRGHEVEVLLQAPRENERCPTVVRVNSVMGMPPEEISKVKPFEDLIPYYPLKRILLEAPEVHKDISMRAVDILTPIGFGQRGLIVAPPRTGKTVLLQNMANSISENFPEVKLILLLIDERPEEVTDFRRHTKGEVVSSTFDETPESHIHCAEMVGEKARRLVEMGQHVVVLLDSITRLARAYNALASNSGKIMSGGMEATAMQRPKRFFGAARNIEDGGSLTILATALVDTGSRMDEVIFEEFKGTGNMELHLDRGLVDKRIFPAINMDRSGTRKEELIYHPEEMLRIYGLRRAMQGIPPVEAMEMLINRLKKTKTNAEFLMALNR